jgi:hypothetical protein
MDDDFLKRSLTSLKAVIDEIGGIDQRSDVLWSVIGFE